MKAYCLIVTLQLNGSEHSLIRPYFHVGFGVRQGSVLSPFLFAIYVNDVGSGCNFDSNVAVILYADDILLIAQSVTMLQTVLNRCENELYWLDMNINVL